MPNRPAPDVAGPDRLPRPARGLHGRLDAPAESVAPGVELALGGWVVHERLTVDRVLVTIDDEVVGHAAVDVPRPDVHERYPHAGGASHRGWGLTVPPVDGHEITIRVYALVESGDDTDQSRLGPWIRFAEATLPVIDTPASFGHLDPIGPTRPGVLRVTGRAWTPDGLARVELTASPDEESWTRARHSQAVAPLAGRTELDSGLSGFAGYVRVPHTNALTVRAVAVGTDGHRHALEPQHVEVVAPAGRTSLHRLAALADRFERRIARLQFDQTVPRRVMVASHGLDLGGAQLYLSLLMDRLRERGWEFCVVARSPGPLQARLEEEGTPVLIFGPDPRNGELLEGQVLQIAEFAREHHVVGCLANSLPTFPAVIATQRLGLPHAWALHESFDLDVFWAEAYGDLPADVADAALAALAASDEVVFEATSTSELYAEIVPPERRTLVKYGVDSTAIDDHLRRATQSAARADLGLRPDALVLGCVGTVEPRKAQLALVRSFARIEPQRRADVQLLLVGMNDSAYARALRDFIAHADLEDCVVLLDVTPDIYPSYLAADVLVSASDIESVPRTMIEAMLMGRPVAATAAFGVGELVTDGVTGFLCEPLDLLALQQMLERVLDTDRRQLAVMGQTARDQVARAHDPTIYVEHFAGRLSSWVDGSAP